MHFEASNGACWCNTAYPTQWWTGTVPDNHRAQFELQSAKPGFWPRQLHLILTANHRKLGYFEGNLPWIHYMARSILRGQRQEWRWNQIKQCFIVISVFHLHKPNWSQTLLSLTLSEYTASLQIFYFTDDSPWQTQGDSIFPITCEALSKQPNSLLPRPLLQNFGVFSVSADYIPIWFPQNSPYLPNLSLLTHH